MTTKSRFTFRYIGMPLVAVAIVTAAATTLGMSPPVANPGRGVIPPARGMGPATGRYTVRVPFIVVPPPRPIGAVESPAPTLNPDDVKLVIARQQFIFEQEKFLTDVLASQEFHPADKPNQECDWLRTNKGNPMAALRRDLRFVSRPEAGAFQITMTTNDSQEAKALVMAAVKVYEAWLLEDSKTRKTRYLLDLETAVKDKQNDFQIKSDALIDYSKRRAIDVMKTRYEVEKIALQDLNREFTLTDAAASNAEQQYEAIDKLRKDGKEIPLSSELAQTVENDFTLKTLLNTRMALEQEKAALRAGADPSSARLKEVDARIEKTDDQIAATRKKLTDDAKERMVKLLADEAGNKRFSASYIGNMRKKKEDIVTGIGQDLLVWQQRVDEVKEAGAIVAKLRAELSLVQANLSVDDTRVARIGGDPVAPDKVPVERP